LLALYFGGLLWGSVAREEISATKETEIRRIIWPIYVKKGDDFWGGELTGNLNM
jgi:hypothetical protein